MARLKFNGQHRIVRRNTQIIYSLLKCQDKLVDQYEISDIVTLKTGIRLKYEQVNRIMCWLRKREYIVASRNEQGRYEYKVKGENNG